MLNKDLALSVVISDTFVKHVIQKIADLKGISFDEVANKTTENARKLFKI